MIVKRVHGHQKEIIIFSFMPGVRHSSLTQQDTCSRSVQFHYAFQPVAFGAAAHEMIMCDSELCHSLHQPKFRFFRRLQGPPRPSFEAFLAMRERCPLLLSLQVSWDTHHPQLLHATPESFSQKSYSPNNMKNIFIWGKNTLIWLFNSNAGFLGWHLLATAVALTH